MVTLGSPRTHKPFLVRDIISRKKALRKLRPGVSFRPQQCNYDKTPLRERPEDIAKRDLKWIGLISAVAVTVALVIGFISSSGAYAAYGGFAVLAFFVFVVGFYESVKSQKPRW